MKEFLLTYWKELACALGFIIVTLVTVITGLKGKKVNVVDNIKEEILFILPFLINSVERPGDGPQKAQEVLEMVYAYLLKKYPTIKLFGYYDEFIINNIEKILSTPQKKEDSANGKR